MSSASSLEDRPEDDGDDAEGVGGEAGGVGGGGSDAQKESMQTCQFCRRPFRKERLAKHEEACKKKAKAIGKQVRVRENRGCLLVRISADAARIVSLKNSNHNNVFFRTQPNGRTKRREPGRLLQRCPQGPRETSE